jgi:hypothetical protein
MSWFGKGYDADEEAREVMAHDRQEAWAYALAHDELPEFVENRLKAAADRKAPWLSTMTPAELLLGQSHGLRPLATVSGTCWFHYGMSWTQGHVEGWNEAVARLKREALAVGANAVVDVQMRTVQSPLSGSMDFTLFGTAVSIAGLPPSRDPVVATVSAMEFVRLLDMGIAVCGIAVGADYDYLEAGYGGVRGYSGFTGGPAWSVQQQLRAFGGNLPVVEQTDFWEKVRREAHRQLGDAARATGTGVLAKTQFGQLIRVERDKQPPNYLGRHIVIGTVVDTRSGDGVPHHIDMVIDMREGRPPPGGAARSRDLDANNEHTGGI